MPNIKHLHDISTLPGKKITEAKATKENVRLMKKLAKIQDKLFAQHKYSVLIVLQGMDTAGKDGAVKHVFSGVNPAGCNVKSFKVPTDEEASHHFLWRISKKCPAKGMMQIFNRSHYEEILSPVVNKFLTAKQVKQRCKEINSFEEGLVKNNTIILKFYLHVSHKEQLNRLADRKQDKHKRWKYQKEDIKTIGQHAKYTKVYETIFKHCQKSVKWEIIPADEKWYKNYRVLKSIVQELEKYPIHYPDTKL